MLVGDSFFVFSWALPNQTVLKPFPLGFGGIPKTPAKIEAASAPHAGAVPTHAAAPQTSKAPALGDPCSPMLIARSHECQPPETTVSGVPAMV